MNNMRTVFIVEDDGDIRELTLYALEGAGFTGVGFEEAGAFLEALKGITPDIVLLDIMLPNRDGLSILKTLRSNDHYATIPVIMLTAKGSEADKVKGLNLGADDYVTKPFGVTELIARINAVLRRRGVKENLDILTCGKIVLDTQKRVVTVKGAEINLTFTEFELLRLLLTNQGLVLSREKIMGADYLGESRTVDMHIKTLRQKLGEAGDQIKTVRGAGYKLGD